jgi:hypothetical protein
MVVDDGGSWLQHHLVASFSHLLPGDGMGRCMLCRAARLLHWGGRSSSNTLSMIIIDYH